MNDSPKKRVSIPVAAAGALALVILAAIALPHFVPARFTYSGQPLSVRVRVADKGGVPIEGANVQVPGGFETTVTGIDGECEAIARFPAGGVVGGAATMHFKGVLQVTAPGYPAWERSWVSLFGETYDYVDQPGTFTQIVIMASHRR